ncbi:xanthine dehydrogenase family protein molybdopterin-binding subunit [Litorivivens sp.]|uniref:xanthine dehydrogenase family protein molybdopterin-binding subunit n=1 Tax=Litorivivens sp. TaxID=2020868 RepID=UPI00356840BF
MNAKTDFKYVGSRPIRPDGADKVTGRARYGADLNVQGMIFGAMVRSPHAHARIKSIDFSAAEKLPGVLAVMGGDDLPDPGDKIIPGGEIETKVKDIVPLVMARDKVHFHAQPVAAVAATSQRVADEAAKLVKVEYEVLPHVLDMHEALQPNAPLLHEDLITHGVEPPPEQPSNVWTQLEFASGDLDKGFAEADIIVERTYSVPMCHQGYIEPHACVVKVDENDRVDIWCSTQGAFIVRAQTAAITGIDVGKIKVTPSEIGGGFGGKTTVYLEPVATVLAKKSGRPVKMVMSREEVFRATGPAAAAETRVKIGVTNDGRLTAFETDILMDTGAYSGHPLMAAVLFSTACYKCDNIRSFGREVVTNKPRVYAYRAPGLPQPTVGVECVMNELAEKLGIDPIEFRLRNAMDEGDVTVIGMPFMKIGLKACLEAAQAHPHYRSQLRDGQGRGVAAAFWINAGMQSSATINVADDGRVAVLTGSPDIGGSRASMALMAAEVLDIPVDRIQPAVMDTDSIGFCDVTGGSRTTLATGGAVIQAAEQLVDDMKARAAQLWQIEPEQVTWRDGKAVAADGEKQLTLQELAMQAGATGGPLTVTARLNAHTAQPAFAVNLCDAAVDSETGKVTVTRFTCIQDAGKAVHPAYVEGQMQGGAVQGIGWALNEEYMFNPDGSMENAGFLDYRVPVASDLPMIDTQIVEVPNPLHPYGVRGVGEVPIVPPMPAVVTAVNRAAGTSVCDLPLTPAKLLAAMS